MATEFPARPFGIHPSEEASLRGIVNDPDTTAVGFDVLRNHMGLDLVLAPQGKADFSMPRLLADRQWYLGLGVGIAVRQLVELRKLDRAVLDAEVLPKIRDTVPSTATTNERKLHYVLTNRHQDITAFAAELPEVMEAVSERIAREVAGEEAVYERSHQASVVSGHRLVGRAVAMYTLGEVTERWLREFTENT